MDGKFRLFGLTSLGPGVQPQERSFFSFFKKTR